MRISPTGIMNFFSSARGSPPKIYHRQKLDALSTFFSFSSDLCGERPLGALLGSQRALISRCPPVASPPRVARGPGFWRRSALRFGGEPALIL